MEINDEIQRDYSEFILGPFHADWIIHDPTELESALTRINAPYEQFVTLSTANINPVFVDLLSRIAEVSIITPLVRDNDLNL